MTFDENELLRVFRKKTTLGVLVFFFVVIPFLGWFGLIDVTNINKLGRYLCFAIVALGIDLLWGYTGLLSLCQALFFCLGGYAMAMHLSLPEGGGNVRPEYHNIPQFFFFNNVDTLPGWWTHFSSLSFALVMAILIPTIVASLFGFTVFRSRVKGVYFSIITQAVAWGAFLLFCRNEMLLGGTNGLTNFDPAFNRDFGWVLFFYLITVSTLVLLFLGAKYISGSRLGRLLVAVRDKEMLLNFMAYRPQSIKLFAFTTAAIFAGTGGVLYVPQNGIITPNIMRVEDSIWMIIWVALGGRGRLWGAMAGALLVNYAYSITTSDMPKTWPFLEGGMFMAVVLFFPSGLVGLWDRFEQNVASGTRVSGILLAMAVGFTALLVDKSNWGLYVPYHLTALIACVTMSFLVIRSLNPSGIVLATITFFFGVEALGLMPETMRITWIGVPLKYYILFIILVGAGVLSHIGVFRQALRKYYEPATEH